MTENTNKKNKHKNNERTVRCPVEGCDEEVLSRALHLHINRKSGNGHGETGTIPEDINLDDAEEVGTAEVEMEYPESRESEEVQRLCPYCERPFQGKTGVMIHLGALSGKKNHPKDAAERHEMNDFPVVRVDENQNVIEIVEEGTKLPSTERRQEDSTNSLADVDKEEILETIENLREQGLDGEANKIESMLLGK